MAPRIRLPRMRLRKAARRIAAWTSFWGQRPHDEPEWRESSDRFEERVPAESRDLGVGVSDPDCRPGRPVPAGLVAIAVGGAAAAGRGAERLGVAVDA